MKPALYLLDTSVMLPMVRGDELGNYIRQKFELEKHSTRALVSIVSHGELWVMAERRKWEGKKREALKTMLDNVVTVDLNAGAIVRAYVEIDIANQAVSAGAKQLSQNDMWIAATAKAAGASLLTADKDFSHLDPTHLVVLYVDPKSKLPNPSFGDQQKLQ